MAPTDAAARQQPGALSIRIAFDLDGTLIDARRRQVGVAAEALAAVTGERLHSQRFWRCKRAGATTAQALKQLGCVPGTAEEVARRWSERIEADDWTAEDRALPGVQRVLGSLRCAGAVITVVTARRCPDGAARSLAASGIAALIDELIVVDPAVAVSAKARALRRCGAAVFIGDTDSDGAAARAAGLPFVAVVTGQRSPGYLQARGCEVAGSLSAALDALAPQVGLPGLTAARRTRRASRGRPD